MSTGTRLTLLFVVLCWAFLSYTLVGSLGLLTQGPLLSTVALVIWFVVSVPVLVLLRSLVRGSARRRRPSP